jgi:hypothetical protein
MWIWTWIFPDNAGPQPWLVADPFGLQSAASWLRKPLQEVLARNEGAARYVVNATGKNNTTELTNEQWLKSLENQIDLTILAEYNWCNKVPIIEDHLISTLRQKMFLESQENSWQEHIEALITLSQKLVESALKALLKAYPAELSLLPKWNYKNNQGQKNWKPGQANYYLNIIRDNTGMLSQNVVERLARQDLDIIRTAIRTGNTSLKPLLFAAILGAVDRQIHPFINKDDSDLKFNRLLDLADLRNKAAHASLSKASKDEALGFAEFAIEWVQSYKEWY